MNTRIIAEISGYLLLVMSNTDLLLRVEHVKYRMPGAAKSPVGAFYVYEDRVEWLDNASDEKLVVLFNDIRGNLAFKDF